MPEIGPRVEPGWWNLLRQFVIFALGVFCVLYATLTEGHDAAILTTGLVLIGLVPLDIFVSRFR